jgi:hypothetical protein
MKMQKTEKEKDEREKKRKGKRNGCSLDLYR